MRIASNSLISIKLLIASFCNYVVVGSSVFDLDVSVVRSAHGLCFLVAVAAAAVELDRVEICERLVGGKRQLAVGVDAILPLVHLLRRGLAGSRAERAGREVDAELFRSAEQLVVFL